MTVRQTNPLAVLLIASVGCAMTVLDTNIVAIVLPTIARDLGASFADVEWVISAYVLSFASLLLPAGAIADRFGRRTIFLLGIGIFAVTSLLCGLAPSARALYVARALQGAGAALLLAPALAIIGHTFHDEKERNKAWAIWGGIMGLTMVLAPILGGLIGFHLGWRWAFYVNVPICILLATSVALRVPESRDQKARRLDPAGIVFFSGAMFGLTSGLINGQAHGWETWLSTVGFVVGVVGFVLFIAVETIQQRPMLDLSLFRLPRFVGAVLAMFAYAACAQVMASLLPLYLQNGLGRPALEAGFAMLPFAMAMLVLPQIGRWLSRFMSSTQVLVFGLAIVCLGNVTTGFGALQGQLPLVIAGMILLGSGGGLLNGETQKAIMGSVPRDRAGMASGISTTSRFSGILLGFAVLSGVLATFARQQLEMAANGSIGLRPSDAPRFADAVIAGDLPLATKLVAIEHQDGAALIARQAYSAGFSTALFVAAAMAAIAAVSVAVLMRNPRREPRVVEVHRQ
ncbi:MFS transporter [Aminobacter sp. AP02]|uniref:MFS transporter n=1 Tax=Aminobacter sp. AP02 TaxID=2135737 RepID=UPI000D7B26D9|nr:MFS transporter [Aminobacter sp. AP02]PWK74047.1 EmrB/QacA subfamily drug resistance transporter [Aminobacter sp. AP02]